jgi:hypothetical protein
MELSEILNKHIWEPIRTVKNLLSFFVLGMIILIILAVTDKISSQISAFLFIFIFLLAVVIRIKKPDAFTELDLYKQNQSLLIDLKDMKIKLDKAETEAKKPKGKPATVRLRFPLQLEECRDLFLTPVEVIIKKRTPDNREEPLPSTSFTAVPTEGDNYKSIGKDKNGSWRIELTEFDMDYKFQLKTTDSNGRQWETSPFDLRDPYQITQDLRIAKKEGR